MISGYKGYLKFVEDFREYFQALRKWDDEDDDGDDYYYYYDDDDDVMWAVAPDHTDGYGMFGDDVKLSSCVWIWYSDICIPQRTPLLDPDSKDIPGYCRLIWHRTLFTALHITSHASQYVLFFNLAYVECDYVYMHIF